MRAPSFAAALGAVAAVVLTGCSSGQPCEDLPALRSEREAARAAYLELVRSGASPDETEVADGELHALERRVFDVEQACAGR